MPRPEKQRCVQVQPGVVYFKPRGIPLRVLDQVQLSFDELEAIRLADLEGLNQRDAAEKMEISRPTFGRIVARARQKVADALVNGKAVSIEGGNIVLRNSSESGTI